MFFQDGFSNRPYVFHISSICWDTQTGIILETLKCVKTLILESFYRQWTINGHVAYTNKKASMGITALPQGSQCLEYDRQMCLSLSYVCSIKNVPKDMSDDHFI